MKEEGGRRKEKGERRKSCGLRNAERVIGLLISDAESVFQHARLYLPVALGGGCFGWRRRPQDKSPVIT